MKALWLGAAALLIAAPVPARAQAPTDVLDDYEIGTKALSVHLEVNLPTAVNVPVIGDVSTLTADISSVDGASMGTKAGPTEATANSDLFESSVGLLNDVLNAGASAALDDQREVDDDVLAQNLGPIKAGLGAVKAKVTEAGETLSSSNLASFFLGLDTESPLVSVSKATATQHGGLVDGVVTAVANAAVSDVNVLGGLVSIGAVETTATAETAGSTASASSSVETTVTNLKVADVLDIDVGPEGVTGTVLGNALPAGLDPEDVFGQINGVLAVAGVQIIAGDIVEEAAENGSTAEASSDGLGIIVNPLKAAEPLVSLRLVPAGVAVAADRAALPPEPQPQPQPEPLPGDELPQTGGAPPLAVPAAVLTVALLLRRGRRG